MAADPNAPGAEVDPHHVAEVIVALPNGTRRRGSGYRTGAGVVLTAAHVIAEACAVQVRFDADTHDEWSADAQELVADPASDLAAVLIDAPAGTRPVHSSTFGRIGGASEEVAVGTVGFPRFKLKDHSQHPSDGSYRDSHQAVGTVAPLSNRRSGLLEVTVRPPAHDPDPRTSPWEGMSGAALWAGGRIIGVLTEHHRSDGLARLAAAPIDRLTDSGTISACAERLRDVLGVPTSTEDLADAAGGSPVTSYRHQVLDLAPEHLLDREDQLRELAAFTANSEPYGWWEGEPWAGKTALMAWFALHPPTDVVVVPFFVSAGPPGCSDGNGFLEAVSEQLTTLSGRATCAPATSAARRRDLLALLEAAAARCRDSGHKLVLAVDGLDEDTGTTTHTASIAALLPRHPPDGTSVLVTSRADRPLPLDVPADHPLHRCARRLLPVSRHARDVERFAHQELAGQLRAGPVHEDLLALITASGGGLSRDDLAELTGESPFTVAEILDGAFGRSVATRAQRLPGAGRGYVLAHRTLRAVAEHELGAQLEHHRKRLHAWSESYQHRGWPAGAPVYLLHDYPRMLAITGDVPRLCSLVTDTPRHERMLEVTGGDAPALDEIALAHDLVGRQPVPDPTAAVLLTVRREELAGRNRHTPVRLPAVWAALGRPARAEALARGIPQLKRRTAALAATPLAAARAGHLDHAEALVTRVDDEDRRDAVLAGIAAAAAVHDLVRAERWARRCGPERRATALARIATAIADDDRRRASELVTELAAASPGPTGRTATALAAVAVGRPDLAELVVADIKSVTQRVRAYVELAGALATADDLRRAEAVVQRVRRPAARLPALATLVRATAARDEPAESRRHLVALLGATRETSHHGDAVNELLALAVTVSDRDAALAADLLAEAHRFVGEVVEPAHHDWADARLAVAHAALGDEERSETLLDGIGSADRLAGALTEIAVDAVRRGEPERAESAVRRVPRTGRRVQAHTELARALAADGDHPRAVAAASEAERMARGVLDPRRLAALATRVVDGLASISAPVLARSIAARIADPAMQGSALTRLAEALAASGDVAAAATIARSLDDPQRRAWVRLAICEALVAAGNRDTAIDTAAAVRTDIEQLTDHYSHVVAFLRLSAALRRVGALDAAVRFAVSAEAASERVADTGRRARAFAQLSVALGPSSRPERDDDLARRAVALLDGIDDRGRRDRAAIRVVEAFAGAGCTDRAEQVARSVTGQAGRVRALSAIAVAISDEPDRAWALLSRAESMLDEVGPVGHTQRAVATGHLAHAGATVLSTAREQADDRHTSLLRVVTGLLATDGWAEAVPALAVLDRSAFSTLVDWLSDRMGEDDQAADHITVGKELESTRPQRRPAHLK